VIEDVTCPVLQRLVECLVERAGGWVLRATLYVSGPACPVHACTASVALLGP